MTKSIDGLWKQSYGRGREAMSALRPVFKQKRLPVFICPKDNDT